MSEGRPGLLPTGVLAIAFGLAGSPVAAQAGNVACATPNCLAGQTAGVPNRPPECENMASPRTIRVRMFDAFPFEFVFLPSTLRIEGGIAGGGGRWSHQCVEWQKDGTFAPWHSATEQPLGSECDAQPGPPNECVTAQSSPSCDFETGNIDDATGPVGLEFSVCHYAFNAPQMHSFQCRLHAASGMTGTLEIVPEIRLAVAKNAAGDALLSWTGGSAAGVRNVFRDTDPAMPPASRQIVLGLTTATSHTDPAAADDAYYLVMEHN